MAGKERVKRKTNGRFYWRKTDEKRAIHPADTATCSTETQTEDEVKIKWSDGRRIVELSELASQLSECKKCKVNPLHLVDCEDKILHGLGSILKIKCRGRQHMNMVYTGKQHRDPIKHGKGMKIFDINSKVALAMIHCGLGPEQLRSLFSALNIPPITVKALKTREREIGKGIEQKAADTCGRAIEQEISMTREPNSNTETAEESGEEINKLSVSYDGAWQKRGSGRSYNSRSAMSFMQKEIKTFFTCKRNILIL